MSKNNLGYRIIRKICELLHKKTFAESDLNYKIAKECGYKNLEELIIEIRRIATDEFDPSVEFEEDKTGVFKIDPVIYYEVYLKKKDDNSNFWTKK